MNPNYLRGKNFKTTSKICILEMETKVQSQRDPTTRVEHHYSRVKDQVGKGQGVKQTSDYEVKVVEKIRGQS